MARRNKRPPNAVERQFGNLFYALFWTLGLIPRPIGKAMGKSLGWLWWHLDRQRKAIALHNLKLAFGEEKNEAERRVLARRVFMNLGLVIYEMCWALRLNPIRFKDFFRIEDIENYEKAAAAGKGVLLLTGHIGNWELLPIVLAMSGEHANVLYRPLDFKPLDHFFIRSRTRFGGQLLSKSKSVLKILKLLRKGENIAVLLDQNVGHGYGIPADFFGRPAFTNKGLAMLAIRTGAPVVPVYIVRENDRYVARILPALPLIRTGDSRKDIEENTQQYNDALEAIIRRHPDQWFWVHRRWRPHHYSVWHPGLKRSTPGSELPTDRS
jgi:KDO2-lipid IV(A) lauroyltransferase